jgi:hypothetical protein
MDHRTNPLADDETISPLTAPRSRRTMLKGALGAGAAFAGAGLLSKLPAEAATTTTAATTPADSVATILTIARTAEQLAVTFYQNAVRAAVEGRLNLTGPALNAIKAAAIEEQLHLNYFAAAGGGSLASTFSFPNGLGTFANLEIFIATQQMLEGVFDSAFIAAVYEFALAGRPDLAQIAAEIAMVESEHRAIGRYIASQNKLTSATDDPYIPANNWGYGMLTLKSVGDAPAAIAAAGFLSPNTTTGNSFSYAPIDYSFDPVYSGVNHAIVSRRPVTTPTRAKLP